ncbi:MAG: DUF1642 domain-containing protein [Lactococcus lactis]
MTKFEEEVKRPANGPLTELNNNMKEVFSQYRKMRQYADYLEYELKQKNEHILKLENENSFMRDERTTFDSNGNSVEPIIPQQALPVVPECVGGFLTDKSILGIANGLIPDSVISWVQGQTYYVDLEKIISHLISIKVTGFRVEKPQLFYLKNKIELEDVGSDLIGYINLFLTNDGYLTSNINRAKKFTQQEIDSMQTGSYEKIEVAE